MRIYLTWGHPGPAGEGAIPDEYLIIKAAKAFGMNPVDVEESVPVYWLHWLCACESDEAQAQEEREKRAESIRARSSAPWPKH